MGSLLATDGLYSWKFPDNLEDLCFYAKGKCWLKSVAHEKLCWIFTDNDVEKEVISKVIGLKYVETEDCDAPICYYKIKDKEIKELQDLQNENRQLKEIIGELTLENRRSGN